MHRSPMCFFVCICFLSSGMELIENIQKERTEFSCLKALRTLLKIIDVGT